MQPFVLSYFANILVYYFGYYSFPLFYRTDRQRAWILTLLSALVTGFGASPLFMEFVSLPPDGNISQIPGLNGPNANAVSIFFMGYLFADLSLGMAHYPRQIHPVSGWIHHTGYLLVILNGLKYEFPGAFLCFASILEIPTICLALGHINKAWRQDYLFGFLFFVTRILLHAYVVHHAFVTYQSNYWMVTAIPYPIHVWWFINWLRQQMRLKSQSNTKKSN